jgi:hypothetical protein
METNTIFVLGIVCGLALVGLVYLIIAVLKMRKEIKGLQNYISNHERDYNNSISSTYSEIKDRSNEIHKRIDDFIERDYTVATTALENEILNNLKYTDSRFDKLISKMDERFDRVNSQIEVIDSMSTNQIDQVVELHKQLLKNNNKK